MKLHRMENRVETGYTTWGSIWEKGTVSEDSAFILKDALGQELPVQSTVTAYWPDHSVKWTSHSADALRMGETAEILPCAKETKQDVSKIQVEETEDCLTITAGNVSGQIMKQGKQILRHWRQEGKKELQSAELVLMLEETVTDPDTVWKKQTTYYGEPESVEVEECGIYKCVVRISGVHVCASSGRRLCPFVLRVTVWKDSSKLDFQHTFIYDGNVSQDALKGLGIRFYTGMEGAVYNRHIRMALDHGAFHESSLLLTSWRPRLPIEIYTRQMDGQELPETGEESEPMQQAIKSMPAWGSYRLFQDSADHFVIEKKTDQDGCCYIQAAHGKRAQGALAFGDRTGGFMIGKKDFWQKYPSGLEVDGLTSDCASATVWFWSPQANAFDYRHYATRGYSQSYYEGFDEMGATPFGIANTNECSIESTGVMIADEEMLSGFSKRVQKPAVYLGEIDYYHKLRAFGYWSRKHEDTQMEAWLEEQLDKAFCFYRDEIEQRSWYGFYNYGDIMHTYDRVRHCWKYDMGGYAWQNTELVPTLWLWLYFMRTQREDVFTMAEAMSRHCSEVDTYHMGPYKGLGARHNVRHWGCPCKEPRIGMAGHHRYYYYLTGDGRMKDVFDDVKDADESTLNIDPLRHFFDKEKMVYPTHARSGPDWSSFCSNWMTQWERFDDAAYLNKIQTGIDDLKTMPLKLVSGSDFEYNPADNHLRYIGERAAGGTHLQICMGSAEVWLELSLLLDDPEWTQMLAEYGRFYYLSREEQIKESNGLVNEREFSLPFMAGAIAAFGAMELKDAGLAKKTWQILMRALISDYSGIGFDSTTLYRTEDQIEFKEIPWITTNFTSQWCLNVIMALEFIREELPQDWKKMEELMKDVPMDGFHRA